MLEEDSFFHKFFAKRARRDEMKGIGHGAGVGNKDKDNSDLIDKALDAAKANGLINDFEAGDTGGGFREPARSAIER